MNDGEITALIQRVPRAFHVWLHGYEAGLIGGRTDQRLEDEEIAELAARIAIAQVEIQADVRTTVRRAARSIDVHLAREKRRIANLNCPDSRPTSWDGGAE